MAYSTYTANVVFGANATGYFQVVANTVQEAATVAVTMYDANAAAFINSNGQVKFIGQASGHNNGIANGTGRTASVFVKDPNVIDLGNRAHEVVIFSNFFGGGSQANVIYGTYFIISTAQIPLTGNVP